MPAFGRLVLLAAVLAAAPAVAQEAARPAPPANPETDVTVTGTLEREQEVRDFVRALTPGPMTGQLARFEESICPAVFGLSGPLKEAVVNRMRLVSEAVGLTVARGDCRPNILLMVTRDKRVLIEQLLRTHPQFFGDEPENNPRRIVAEPGPAAAWHATVQLNADGRAMPARGGFLINQTTRSGGRISQPTRPVFFAAAVVVERRALEGLTTIQLADYALMRALARTDPSRLPPASPRSILSVLEAPMGSEIPITITRWDLGFLRGLYASTANLRSTQQRGEIQRRVGAELERPEDVRN